MDQTSDPHSLQNPITKTYVGSRTLGARGGGVRDAVVGRVLAMGLRAEVAEQGVVGRCRPGWGGGDGARFCSHGGRNAGTHQAVIRTSDKTTTTWSSGEYGGALF